MKKIKLFFTLLILCLCILGCDEGVPNPMQLADIISQYETVVQTEIPPEVLAAMKIHADEQEEWIRNILALGPANAYTERDKEWLLEEQRFLRENGYDKMDFHEPQKEYYTRYIDAGGIAIVGPETLADEELIYARNAIVVMTSKHPELKDRLLSKHGTFYMVLVKYFADMPDIPELQLSLSRARSKGTQTDWIAASCNASTGPGAQYKSGFCYGSTWVHPTPEGIERQGGNPCATFVHEFAHALESEIERLNPGFMENFAELEEIYENSDSEILAMGATGWFFSIHPDRKHKTYEEFFEAHPLLAPLLDEWFPRVSLAIE